MAEVLVREGRRSESLLLYEGRPDHPALRGEALWAVSEGVASHLLAIRRMGREVTEHELRDCARAAEDRGRWMDARNCYLALGDEEAIRKIAEHLPDALKPEAAADSETD